MLLQDEIIIFSRAYLFEKIKNGIFSIRKLIRKHAFSGICKKAWNFSKDYLSWAWKIRKFPKIIVYLWKPTQSLRITISFWSRKSYINARNITNYSKKINIYSESAVWYWKSKIRSAKAIFHCSRLKREFRRGFFTILFRVSLNLLVITGNWLHKILDDWELTSLPLFTFFWIDIF